VQTGESVHVVNLSSYNYLGFSYHPEVIKAAQDAVAKYGLGAPVLLLSAELIST